MDSILTTVKAHVGIEETYDHFDPEIIAHINSVFVDLNDMGVGPDEIFSIEDKSATWDDFMQENKSLARVISYLKLRVKLLFDPPSSSVVIDAMNRSIDQLEWRMTNDSNKEGET